MLKLEFYMKSYKNYGFLLILLCSVLSISAMKNPGQSSAAGKSGTRTVEEIIEEILPRVQKLALEQEK
jgi:hypothetical protein